MIAWALDPQGVGCNQFLSLVRNLDEVNISKMKSEKCYAYDFDPRRAYCLILFLNVVRIW